MWSCIGLTLQNGTWKGPLCHHVNTGPSPTKSPLTSEVLAGREGVLSPSHPLTDAVMKPPPKSLWAPLDSILYTHLRRQERPGSTWATVCLPMEKAGRASGCREGKRGPKTGKRPTPILEQGRPGFKSNISRVRGIFHSSHLPRGANHRRSLAFRSPHVTWI